MNQLQLLLLLFRLQKMTVNESKTASFQCSVSANPKPVSTWSKLEGKPEKILSATRDGKLILPNATGSDSGVYKCSASNTLGQAQALVRLVVNGKFCYVNRLCWFSNRSKSSTTLRPSNFKRIQFIRAFIWRTKAKVKMFLTSTYM